MVARIFVCLVLLVGVIMTFQGWSPADLRGKISEFRNGPTPEADSISRDEWSTILPGKWQDEKGGVTIIYADGRFEHSGREKAEEPVPNSPVTATVFADFSRRIKGTWSLKEDRLISTIQSVDQLVVHDFQVRSPQIGAAVLRDVTIKARQQFMFDATHKLKNKTHESKLISVQRDEIISSDLKGKKETSRRIK